MRWLLFSALLLVGCQKGKGVSTQEKVPPPVTPVVAEKPVGSPSKAGPEAAKKSLPEESLYQLSASLTDQDGQKRLLASFAGKPVVVSMFYAHCPNACPLLIHKIQSLEGKLPKAQRDDLQVLLVSFAPDVDTDGVLKSLAKKQDVDEKRWRLVRTEEQSVRELAAVLGISYRKLDDGNYNHASVLTLLDRQGVAVAKLDGLGSPSEAFLDAMKQQTQTPPQ